MDALTEEPARVCRLRDRGLVDSKSAAFANSRAKLARLISLQQIDRRALLLLGEPSAGLAVKKLAVAGPYVPVARGVGGAPRITKAVPRLLLSKPSQTISDWRPCQKVWQSTRHCKGASGNMLLDHVRHSGAVAKFQSSAARLV